MFKTSPEGKYYQLLFFPGKDIGTKEVKETAQSHTELGFKTEQFDFKAPGLPAHLYFCRVQVFSPAQVP